MAVLSSTGTITPVIGAETTVVTIAPGTPLDNITVYFQGGQFGGGGAIGLALYAVVGGFNTRVAQAKVQGSAAASIVEFQSLGKGDSATEEVDAAGTSYFVTAIDLSGGLLFPGAPTRQPITITLAGVNTFDTAADANFGNTFGPLVPGAGATLPTLSGYAQLMDVAVNQTSLPGVLITVFADCGAGTVQATVAEATLSGQDETIAGVFRGLKLPVATRYFVSITNVSTFNITAVTLTAVTYSLAVTAGGSVTLGGDVIGPSNANTVIKWDNVALTLSGTGSFGAPADAAIPIFDTGTGSWRALTISGDATMTDAGVVTVTGGSVTLVGNANGPAGTNTVQAFATSTTNAPINVGTQTHPTGEIYEGFNGLTANQTGTLNATPTKGDKVIWKDEDGSLANFTFEIIGNGHNIDGAATFTMTDSNVGEFGSITVLYTGTMWAII